MTILESTTHTLLGGPPSLNHLSRLTTHHDYMLYRFGSRSTQYLQGIFADYKVHPLYYSLASLGSYKNRGSFLTATLCPLSVCKTVLLARGSALASDHPDSPIASCNVSEAACLERKSGKCKMCSSPRGEGPQHEEGTCPGDNEAELQYRAKQGAFCKVCKDCIADTWH